MKTKSLPDGHVYKAIEENDLTVEGFWRNYVFTFQKNLLDKNGDKLWGSVDFEKGEISLDLESGDSSFAMVNLLHELMHIVLQNCGLQSDLEIDGKLRSMSNEEMTEIISVSLTAFIKNNKQLFELILGAFDET